MSTSTLLQKTRAAGHRAPLSLRPHWILRGSGLLAVVLVALLLLKYPVLPATGWAVGLALTAIVRLDISGRTAKICSRAVFAAMPLITYSLVEHLNYNKPWSSFSPLQIVLNLAWYYLGAILLYYLTGRRDLSARLGLVLGWAFGMVNHYLLSFRGRTLFPGDLLTLRTAANVAGNYNYMPDRTQVTTGLIVLLCLFLSMLLPAVKGRVRPTLRLAAPAALSSALFFGVFFGTDFLANAKIEPSMWTTRGNGLALNFTVCLRYSRMDKPEGYSVEALKELSEGYSSAGAMAPNAPSTQPVNVIAIMNESFSDLGVIPGVESNQDWMPFWNALQENTVKGYAYASVFGGTTANSEYEFLTGNTTAFLPAGTVPYQMYVTDGDPSLVSQMKELGYRTVAMHPYWSSGWNRIPVYTSLGFDEMYFQSDMKDPEFIRGYISDQSNFENIIRIFEQKQPGESLFLFDVTMQNHSAYNVPWTNLEKTTWLTGEFEGRFSTVDQYLSLIYESDRAFEYLVNYFAQVEEPTVIVMFGDHQPQVATNFYTDALGGPVEELDTATAQLKQMVPFLIWANYDIQEQEGVEISLNYLSSLFVRTAGLPQTGYQRFLNELSRVLPVVNTRGYRDHTGMWSESPSALPQEAASLLEQYRSLVYNNVFDKQDRIESFFKLVE